MKNSQKLKVFFTNYSVSFYKNRLRILYYFLGLVIFNNLISLFFVLFIITLKFGKNSMCVPLGDVHGVLRSYKVNGKLLSRSPFLDSYISTSICEVVRVLLSHTCITEYYLPLHSIISCIVLFTYDDHVLLSYLASSNFPFYLVKLPN